MKQGGAFSLAVVRRHHELEPSGTLRRPRHVRGRAPSPVIVGSDRDFAEEAVGIRRAVQCQDRVQPDRADGVG